MFEMSEFGLFKSDFGAPKDNGANKYMSEEARKQLDLIANLRQQGQEAELNRKKEEKERKKRREDFKRKRKLLEAAFEGNIEIIEKAIDEVEEHDTKEGLTHLGIDAIIRRHHRYQLVDCEDAYGNTPLSEAAGGGQVAAIQLLVEEGAMPNRRGQCNRTPLYRAAFSGHPLAVQELLELGADPRIHADDSQTPKDVAGDDGVIKVLEEWDIEKTKEMLLEQEETERARQEENKERREYEAKQMEENAKKAEEEAEERKKLFLKQRAAASVQQFGYQQDSWYGGNNGNHTDMVQDLPGVKVSMKDIEEVLVRDADGKIDSSGKWPLIIDPSQKAATFLRYRDNFYVNALSERTLGPDRIRMTIIGALRFGKGVILDLMGADVYDKCVEKFDQVGEGFMRIILDKTILEKRVYKEYVKDSDGDDYQLKKFNQVKVDNFRFYIVTQSLVPSDKLLEKTYAIRMTED